MKWPIFAFSQWQDTYLPLLWLLLMQNIHCLWKDCYLVRQDNAKYSELTVLSLMSRYHGLPPLRYDGSGKCHLWAARPYREISKATRPCANINTFSTNGGIPFDKIKQSLNSLMFYNGIPILVIWESKLIFRRTLDCRPNNCNTGPGDDYCIYEDWRFLFFVKFDMHRDSNTE